MPSNVVVVFRSWSCSSTVSSLAAARRLSRQMRSNCRTRPRTRAICPARMIGVPMAHRSCAPCSSTSRSRPGRRRNPSCPATRSSRPALPAGDRLGRGPWLRLQPAPFSPRTAGPVSFSGRARHGPHRGETSAGPQARRILPWGAKPSPRPGGNAATVRRFPSRRRAAVAGRQCQPRRPGRPLPWPGVPWLRPRIVAKWGLPTPRNGRTNTPLPQTRGYRERPVRRCDTTWCSMNRHLAMLNCNDSVGFAGTGRIYDHCDFPRYNKRSRNDSPRISKKEDT